MAVERSSGSLHIRYSKLSKRRHATIMELVIEDDDVVYPRDDNPFLIDGVCFLIFWSAHGIPDATLGLEFCVVSTLVLSVQPQNLMLARGE